MNSYGVSTLAKVAFGAECFIFLLLLLLLLFILPYTAKSLAPISLSLCPEGLRCSSLPPLLLPTHKKRGGEEACISSLLSLSPGLFFKKKMRSVMKIMISSFKKPYFSRSRAPEESRAEEMERRASRVPYLLEGKGKHTLLVRLAFSLVISCTAAFVTCASCLFTAVICIGFCFCYSCG